MPMFFFLPMIIFGGLMQPFASTAAVIARAEELDVE
jgi:hypothetical protein